MTIVKAITVAGSDTSGGAGLQADLKTFQEFGIYGMTAITVIVAQNPAKDWAHDVYPLPLATIEAQLETVLAGIGVHALKTGMLATSEVIALVAKKIDQYSVKNVVIDPVMVCKGTDEVLHPEAAVSIRRELAPRATIITPNIFEAGQLSGLQPIRSVEDMKAAAIAIHQLGPKNVLIKGGAKLGTPTAIDLLFDGEEFEILESPKIDTKYTHGAGCTYAAAITAGLAKGLTVREAVRQAKTFVTTALAHSFPLNKHVGPLCHAARRLK
ncbi:pyridoxine/pyridoxal/pyridoxamine kinase|uniref:pyridoxal kinase n=1 Tax=Dendrosporobacter quercicolus TaxID=146817 RepID=A0A1G9YA69_9FIRM|nr:pyridoxine/pyridoxal/pyridoxamine kinase [Dendrosporobacter quercicolus]NSL47584.1 pyridoxine/pyridoxal/pyridoxamine kinase [Dendrosporobacter quercicolus DSM 1736]SDN05947.1 pyridoxine kinase [Dendrosporobacter quercicolus]